MKWSLENHSVPGNQSTTNKSKIQEAAALIQAASYPIVLTGAGSSTPSGIPDFRSPRSGLWTRFSPFEFASLTSFRYNPERFFQWLRPLAALLYEAEPNPSHGALSALESCGKLKAVITQNIDNLHQKAGSEVVIEVHGSLSSLSCIGCFKQFSADQYLTPYLQEGIIPHCPICNHILKPDVVLFEEQLPIQSWLKAKTETMTCDLMIVAGSSLTVSPVCELPMEALENDAKLIVVNLTPTYIDSYSDIVFHDDVSIILPAIVAEIFR